MKQVISKFVIGSVAVAAFSGHAIAAPAPSITTTAKITSVTYDAVAKTYGASFSDVITNTFTTSKSFSDGLLFTLTKGGDAVFSATTTTKANVDFFYTLDKVGPGNILTELYSSTKAAPAFSYDKLAAGNYELFIIGNEAKRSLGRISGNLTVTPVPEAETYSMMLMGLGLMGFIARRRRNDEA